MTADRRRVKERVETQKKEPTLYKVVLLNDDYTTMEFVVQVLESVFQKSPAEAYQIMMHVHVNGRGIAGVYPWEVAETKAEKVISLARESGFPLKAVDRRGLTAAGAIIEPATDEIRRPPDRREPPLSSVPRVRRRRTRRAVPSSCVRNARPSRRCWRPPR